MIQLMEKVIDISKFYAYKMHNFKILGISMNTLAVLSFLVVFADV